MTGSGGKLVHSVGEAAVLEDACGPTTLLRFAGKCSPSLSAWLPSGLAETRGPVALHLRELSGIDEGFVREVVRFAREVIRRKRQVVLLDPPGRIFEFLEREGAAELLPALSGEAALREGVSLSDAILKEKAALADLASRYLANPLWRKVDQEDAWLCPVCGTEIPDVRIPNVLKPPAVVFRGMRSHLLERCAAWRSGRRLPLPASALEAFLAEVNQRKAAAQAETRFHLSRQVESLQDLERSVEEAKRKQLHLLPVEPDPDPVADIAVVYRPLQSVSGDFLDFYSLEGDRFGVAIGDVSGHGVETAITMGMAKMALRVRSQALGTLREIMAHANRDLFSELRRSAFVTGVFATIERSSRRMAYVRAGHTRPLLRRAAGGCLELEGEGLPFGVDEGRRFASGLDEREVGLAPGDVLLLYTDGVIEAGPASGQFGVERLKQALLASPAEGTARAILDWVVGALDGFLGPQALGDDVTLVCLKIL
jgi:serine phosphatase RsbU (regulator of sigma subunit)